MSKELTVLSTNGNMWQEVPARLVKHIVTGEVMAYLDYFGDGYGSGSDVEVSRFNKVTGMYEKLRMPRKALTDISNESYQEKQTTKPNKLERAKDNE